MLHTWYADDGAATRKIVILRLWWDEISHLGPSFRYQVNASKTWLVIKKEFQLEVDTIFGDTKVKITSEGHPYLGALLNTVPIRVREGTAMVEGTKIAVAGLSEAIRHWSSEVINYSLTHPPQLIVQ